MRENPNNQSLSKIIGEMINGGEKVNALWHLIFGTDFSRTWSNRTWALDQIVNVAQNILNLQGRRIGHVSLFIREPLTDRLTLERSTNQDLNRGTVSPRPEYFRNIAENFDPERRVCYYQLSDRIHRDGEQIPKLQEKHVVLRDG